MKRRGFLKGLPLAAVTFGTIKMIEADAGSARKSDGPINPYPEPLLADDVTGTDAFAKWNAWEQAHGTPNY